MTDVAVSFRPQSERRERLSALWQAEPADTTAYRVAPLLVVLETKDGAHDICVGDVLVTVDEDAAVTLDVNVTARWQESDFVISEEPSRVGVDIAALLERHVNARIGAADLDGLDANHVAAWYAKVICERSRNQVGAVRELRYGIERRMAEESRGHSADEKLTGLVSSLLLLSIACGRAADHAREAVREGLWTYLSDDDAYHAYRLTRDPTLISARTPATQDTRSWMRLHDAAIRQLEAMTDQLSAEASALVGLLEAASSISGSRDADAQTRLNLLIALVSLGLGVPALILALYGATVLLPLQTVRQNLAFAPVVVPLLVSGSLAFAFAPRGSTRKIWRVAGIAVMLVAVLLYLGGIILDERAE